MYENHTFRRMNFIHSIIDYGMGYNGPVNFFTGFPRSRES